VVRREGHLGRAHQAHRVALAAIGLLLAARKVSRADHHRVADQHRHGHLHEAPLDHHFQGQPQDGLVQGAAVAPKDVVAGPGQLDPAVDVQHPELGHEGDVVLGLEAEPGGLADAADLDVLGVILADGHLVGRRLSNRQQGGVELIGGLPVVGFQLLGPGLQLGNLPDEFIGLGLELLLGPPRGQGLLERRTLGVAVFGDLVADLVLAVLDLVHLRLEGPPAVVERADGVDVAVDMLVARRRLESFRVLANRFDVDHICSCRIP